MIKPVEYDGLKWRVGFEYVPRREACKSQGGPVVTICRIWPEGPREGPRKTLAGAAHCAPGDRPSYEIGRKLALTRALAEEPKDFRQAIWQAYLGRKGQKGGSRDLTRVLAGILDQCQGVLGRYLPPDGISADQAISELLGVLDCSQTLQVISRAREEGPGQHG